MQKGIPISPDEIPVVSDIIPPEVFNIVNELLILRSTGGIITITKKEIIYKIKKRMSTFRPDWLNFENAYRDKGWVVTCRRDEVFGYSVYLFDRKKSIFQKIE